MGIQIMSSHMISGGGQKQAHVRQHSSWFSLTLDEIKNRLGNLGKPFVSLNLDELLRNVLNAEAQHLSGTTGSDSSSSPSANLQRQASMSFARALKGKTVHEVWREINKTDSSIRSVDVMCSTDRESNMGEMTLEDFLVKAGTCLADNANNTSTSLRPVMSLDSALSSQIGLSSSPSINALSDTPTPGRKRESLDLDKAIERRLKRKIKNRESAARSRARKQAYHNELVSKVTNLEEENMKLGKEKEFDEMVTRDITEPRYQLRRMSSI